MGQKPGACARRVPDAPLGSTVWTLYRMVDLFGARLLERAERTSTKLDDQLVPPVG